MSEVKRLNREHKIEEGKVVITETVQTTMDRRELEVEKMGYLNRIANLEAQITNFKNEKASYVQMIADIDDMIAAIPLETDDEE